MELSKEKKSIIDSVEPVVVSYFGLNCQFDLYVPNINQKTSTARFYLWYFLHSKAGFSITELSNQYQRSRRNISFGIAKTKYRIERVACYKELYAGMLDMINNHNDILNH